MSHLVVVVVSLWGKPADHYGLCWLAVLQAQVLRDTLQQPCIASGSLPSPSLKRMRLFTFKESLFCARNQKFGGPFPKKTFITLFFKILSESPDFNFCYCWAYGWVHRHNLSFGIAVEFQGAEMFQRRVVGRAAKGSCPIKSWVYFALWFSNFSWCVSPCTMAVVHYDHKHSSPWWSAL